MQPDQITDSTLNRQAALNGLAIVGFIALVAAGIWLAVYSARYVPSAVSRIGTAAVSLSSLFSPVATSSLAVVPPIISTTTISFGTSTSTATTSTPVQKNPNPVLPHAGSETSATYPLGTGGATNYYGLPDLAVNITSVGYLDPSTSSFVASSSVPAGDRPAVQFTVRNIGTNTAGPWSFSASIPTVTSYVYDSVPQQSLNPGDSIDYTLGFDQPNLGQQTISIDVNYNNAIPESSTANNTASVGIDIL